MEVTGSDPDHDVILRLNPETGPEPVPYLVLHSPWVTRLPEQAGGPPNDAVLPGEPGWPGP